MSSGSRHSKPRAGGHPAPLLARVDRWWNAVQVVSLCCLLGAIFLMPMRPSRQMLLALCLPLASGGALLARHVHRARVLARARAAQDRLCVRCGYQRLDDSPCCPECGLSHSPQDSAEAWRAARALPER